MVWEVETGKKKQLSLGTCAILEMILGDRLFEELIFELPRVGKPRAEKGVPDQEKEC